MAHDIRGLHHVTAITGSAGRNRAFYAGALGLRLVKRTVNFDDPTAWHLYYGDAAGAPGGIMTFFAWERGRPGRAGAGQVSETLLAAPPGSLDFWVERLPRLGGRLLARDTRFGRPCAAFADPDGLRLVLVETPDPRTPWTTPEVGEAVALRGFLGVTLRLAEAASTAAVLTDVLGYAQEAEAGGVLRFRLGGAPAGVVDLVVDPAAAPGADGAGVVHHVAFSVADRAAQARVRARMEAAGLRVTEPIDRDYFWAIYARTPGGVLFEVATDEPGFAVDETPDALGEALKLPARYEPHREQIVRRLAPLDG
jgi:glyoxalase family protein